MRNSRLIAKLAFLAVASAGCAGSLAAGPSTESLPIPYLKAMLAKMDKARNGFTSIRADFKLELHSAANHQTDEETGETLFRRETKGQDVNIRLLKHVTTKNGQPAMLDLQPQQMNWHKIGDADPQWIMTAFAFGIKGEDLLKDYEITSTGREMVDHVQTARLELVGLKGKAPGNFNKMILWIDLERGVAIQQQRFAASGDFEQVHYSDIAQDPDAVELNTVLAKMDKTGKGFKSAQADFRWEQYTAVVNETDEQIGQIFLRRKGKDQEVAIRISSPHPKRAVIKNNQATMYDPMTNQTSERKFDSSDAQSMMNAFAFGVRGEDLLKDYEVTFTGWAQVDNIRTARLELVARKEKIRSLFTKVILWMDLDRDVAIQQKRLEASGDYQLAHYTNIVLDSKIPDDAFAIKK